MFRNLIPALADRYHVVAPDYPGYGKSRGRPSEAGCYAAAEAGRAWLSGEAGLAPEQLVVMGKSLGGAVATHLVLAAQEAVIDACRPGLPYTEMHEIAVRALTEGMVGLGLLAVTLAFGFTGYLLPWDQKAYWATTVGTRIVEVVPVVGDLVVQFVWAGMQFE